MQLYKNIPLEQDKRHLIVGDIHGRLTTLYRLLESINYDPADDILYSVGDLVDRGPYSLETIEFFTKYNENRYVIMGNHEYMMIHPDQWRDVWIMNGGQKTVDSIENNGYTQEQANQMVHNFPVVLDVGASHEENSFRLVHAEFPKDWSDQYLMEVLERDPSDRDVQELIWGRNLINLAQICYRSNTDPNEALTFASGRHRWTFCGHTPISQVQRFGDVYFTDTFRSEPRTLSIVDAITKQVHSHEVID